MINLKNISKSYGVTHLFTGVDLGIHEGNRIGVLGPNGCGKTTLLKIIYGIEQPDSGMVMVGNTTKIGYLPTYNLYYTTFAQKLGYFLWFNLKKLNLFHNPFSAHSSYGIFYIPELAGVFQNLPY